MRYEERVTRTEERRNEREFVVVEKSQGKRPLERILLEYNLEKTVMKAWTVFS
jgi:hypothetical protein